MNVFIFHVNLKEQCAFLVSEETNRVDVRRIGNCGGGKRATYIIDTNIKLQHVPRRTCNVKMQYDLGGTPDTFRSIKSAVGMFATLNGFSFCFVDESFA